MTTAVQPEGEGVSWTTIDREHPQALCNWIDRKRFVQGGVGQKTFFVNKVTGEERKLKPNYFFHEKSFSFSKRSLFTMGLNQGFRRFVVSIITNPWFDRFILFTIILNSLFLAMPRNYVAYGVDLEYDMDFKTSADRTSWWNDAYTVKFDQDFLFEADPAKSPWTEATVVGEYIFTFIFTLECLLKIIGMGFCVEKGAYLRDSWNALDFVVVMSGLSVVIPGFPRISALRTVRVMRPFRSLSVLPSMRNLINTLLNSMPALLTVLTLLWFVFLIFGILAIQLWNGVQNYRCRLTPKPLQAPLLPLVFSCAVEGAVLDNYLCTAHYEPDDWSAAFECADIEECVVKEHFALMGEVFGAMEEGDADGADAPYPAKKYAAAMVTRVFRQETEGGFNDIPIHYCGHNEASMTGDARKFPSYHEGIFPGHTDLVDGDLAKTAKLDTLTKDDGPWAKAEVDGKLRSCFWPIYEDGRVCSMPGLGLGGGLNKCGRMLIPFPAEPDWNAGGKSTLEPAEDGCNKGADSYWDKVVTDADGSADFGQCMDIQSQHTDRQEADLMYVRTTCGSNWDRWGNRRFKNEAVHISGHFQEGLAFGFTKFDDIFHAFQSIFQAITEEGWTDIMYQLMDADNYFFAAFYFCALIIFGSFICLNLTLAIMWQEFTAAEEKLAEMEARSQQIRDDFADQGQNVAAEAEAKEAEAKEKEAKAAKAKDALSYYYFGLKGSHGDSSNCFIKGMFKLVENGYFEAFIVVCILLNTVTLSLDRYNQPAAEANFLEVVNFILTLVFILEMVFKLIGLGMRQYVSDAFNRFDAIIVLGSIVELALMPPSFIGTTDGGSGGALSVLRGGRLLRLFKLARSWHSLHHLLATIYKTLGDITSFALLLMLFIYVFALCAMQIFANRFRFGDDGHVLDPIVGKVFYSQEAGVQGGGAINGTQNAWDHDVPVYDMPTNLWQDPDSQNYLNPEYFAATPPRAHFDNFLWSCTTVFQVLSGENWNTVMYDGWRSVGRGSWFFFMLLIVSGIMIVLELFVAVLLGNFEAGSGDDDEDGEDEEEEFGGHGMIKGAHAMQKNIEGEADENAPKENIEDFSKGDFWHRMILWLECGDKSTEQQGATSNKVVPVDESAASKTGEGKTEDGGDGVNKSVSFAENTAEEPAAKKVEDKHVLKGTAFWLMGPNHPFRVMVSKIVFFPWFDRVILIFIILSSIMLAIESPLDAPGTTKADIFKVLDLFFTIAFILEMVLKHLTLGVCYYWVDSWNMLDGVIVIISCIVLGTDGNGSFTSLKALRTLRVLRPLRMINRAPRLKRVVNALLFSVPKIMDVLVLCALFFLMFAILGINFLKGNLHQCSGDLTGAEEHFLLDAKWSALVAPADLKWTYKERLIDEESPFATCQLSDAAAATEAGEYAFFDADGHFQVRYNTTDNFYETWDTDTGTYGPQTQEEWELNSLPYNSNTDKHDISCECKEGKYECLTSKDACLALYMFGRDVSWDKVVYQSFDNLPDGFSTLFEISTTEGWVDVMYAAVDARGRDMQPDRHTDNVVWVGFFVAFIIMGSFFVINLFVGVVCDTFNEMREKFGATFLMTEQQKQWVELRRKINKLGKYVIAHLEKKAPTNWRKPFYTLVTKPIFDHIIMGCIIANTFIMMFRHLGQSADMESFLTNINLVFAVIFTIEMVLKLIALLKDYFNDGWNVFDFIIVIATDVFIVVKYTTDLNLVSIATVMRTFRVLRIFRLIQSAKSLRMLINTLIISLPQLANIAALLLLSLFIFAVMGVQMFALTGFSDALNEQANFQNFGIAILTLMRSTTGENWNGMMHSMTQTGGECMAQPKYDAMLCGFEGAIEECLPLNGCGNPAMAFMFWTLFTLFVSFVVLNVFVAVLLEAFENSSDEEEKCTLTDAQWKIFCETWVKYIPKSISDMSQIDQAFRIDMDKLLPFFKELPFPMGFSNPGEEMKSDKVLWEALTKMDIKTVRFKTQTATGDAPAEESSYAEFWSVANAVGKRVMMKTSSKEDALLLEEFTAAEAIERSHSGKNFNQRSHKDAVVQLNLKQYFAALRIACAFRSHKFREKIAERVCVQEEAQAKP